MRERLGCRVLLAVLLGSTSLWGATPILIVTEGADDPVARRLEVELSTLGLDALLTPPPAAGTDEDVARMTRERGAAAAIRVRARADGAVLLWVNDRVTGKQVLRELRPGANEGVEELALRALELLRASLLELDLPSPPKGEVPPSPAVVSLVPPRREATPGAAPGPSSPPDAPYTFLVGPGGIWSPGGAGAASQGFLSLRYLRRRGVGAEVFGSLPLGASSLRGPEGEASLRVRLVGAGFRLSWEAGPLDVSTGGGLGYSWMAMEGRPAGGFVGATDGTRALFFHGGIGGIFRLSRRVGVGAEGQVMVTAPVHRVRFAGREAASWGLPALSLALVVEMRFP
jgi:hypothetical protein